MCPLHRGLLSYYSVLLFCFVAIRTQGIRNELTEHDGAQVKQGFAAAEGGLRVEKGHAGQKLAEHDGAQVKQGLAAAERGARVEKGLAGHDGTLKADPQCAVSDPIPTFPSAMLAMGLGMVVILGMGYGLTLAGAGAAQQAASAHGSVPKMPVLDALRAWMVFNIIQGHQGTPWRHMGVSSDGLVVLSGFLLFATQGSRREAYDRRGAAAFVAHRLARLTPGYYAALILSAACLPVSHISHRRPYVAWPLSALFLQSLAPTMICSGGEEFWLPWGAVGQCWYVSVTMLHALVFPLFFNLVRKASGSALSTLLALGSILGVRLLVEFLQHRGFMDVGTWQLAHRNFAPLRILDVVAGMLAAQLCDGLPPSLMVWRGWRCAVPLTVSLALWTEPNALPWLWPTTGAWCALLVSARCAEEAPPLLPKGWAAVNACLALAESTVATLGKYSWGAYLYQWLAFDLLYWLWPQSVSHFFWLPGALSFLLAVPADRLLDGPAARIVRARLGKA